VFPSCLTQNPSRARAGNRPLPPLTCPPPLACMTPVRTPVLRPGSGAGHGHIYRLDACRKLPQFRLRIEVGVLYVRPRVSPGVPFIS